jgi:hypothetical protein
MKRDEKMWYSIKEAIDYLQIDENRLLRRMNCLNLEARTLPGQKGRFIARQDVLSIEQSLRGPRLTL